MNSDEWRLNWLAYCDWLFEKGDYELSNITRSCLANPLLLGTPPVYDEQRDDWFYHY